MRVNLRYAVSFAIVAGLAGSIVISATCAADHSGTDETWTTKKIMDKLHVGKQALLSIVKNDLQKAKPDWKSDEDNLTEIIRLMSMLTKQKPSRGSQEAWNRLVQDYVDAAKAARRNIQDHWPMPARTALAKVISTCEECHDNHGIQ